MGNSEWAQGPLRPQPILRAALGAAPEGPAGGVGHYRPPCARGPGLDPELLSQEGPPGSPPRSLPLPQGAEGSFATTFDCFL